MTRWGAGGLTVQWDQTSDVAGLTTKLRNAGVPTEVRTGLSARFVLLPRIGAGVQEPDRMLTRPLFDDHSGRSRGSWT
ncbi:hypothetical protein AWW66_23170 [Micromonospora rosaria]|uniref:Uncharacterized protein n=1 Tax=Micromonospora rosaria TaxID=47874 RepID=A0A136PMS3_9ACTN|nr:hypothetical protein AWW66_23170 [Micromonospora rosaria]